MSFKKCLLLQFQLEKLKGSINLYSVAYKVPYYNLINSTHNQQRSFYKLRISNNNICLCSFNSTAIKSRKYSWSSNKNENNIFLQTAKLSSSPATRKEFSEQRILGYSMEQMFDVVSDVKNYQSFLPWCESSVVTSQKSDHLTANLKIGKKPLLESYTSNVIMDKPTLIKATAKNGVLFTHLMTQWKFSPGLKTHPQSCIVDFQVSFEFRSLLTAQLANVFFNEVVKMMTGAFYKEAQKRYGNESLPSRKIAIVSDNSNKKS